jgi:hypothetical protein
MALDKRLEMLFGETVHEVAGFDAGEAIETPVIDGDEADEGALEVVSGGWRDSQQALNNSSNSVAFSNGKMWSLAESPCFRALRETAALPLGGDRPRGGAGVVSIRGFWFVRNHKSFSLSGDWRFGAGPKIN